MDISNIIDWTSIKLSGLSVVLCLITFSQIMGFMTFIAVASTIVYNAIRIYKEFKKKKNE